MGVLDGGIGFGGMGSRNFDGGVLGRGLCCIGIFGGDAAVAWCGVQICIGTTSSGQVWRWSAEVVLPGWGGVD